MVFNKFTEVGLFLLTLLFYFRIIPNWDITLYPYHHLFKIYDYWVGEFKTTFMEFIMKKAIFVLFSLLFASSVFAGQCDYSYQQDKSGNSCGERSKYNDYGTQRTQDPFDTTGRNKSNNQDYNYR